MTTWYLEATGNDPTTNDYLVQIIGEQNPECLQNDKLCADGKRRNLFRCPAGYANVRSAIVAIARFNLKIGVFQEQEDGAPVRFELWKKSVRKVARLGAFRKRSKE